MGGNPEEFAPAPCKAHCMAYDMHTCAECETCCLYPTYKVLIKPLVLDMQKTVVSSTPNAYAWLRSPHAVLLNSSGVCQIPHSSLIQFNRTCMHLINSNTESLNRRSHQQTHAQQYYSQCLVFQMLSAMQLMTLRQNIIRKQDLLIMICQWTDWQLFPGSVINSFRRTINNARQVGGALLPSCTT